MKYRPVVLGIAAAALLTAQVMPAYADDWHHHGGGGGYHHGGGGSYHHGGGGLLWGVAAATAALVTLPFAAVGALAGPPAPVYEQPAYAYPPYGYAPAYPPQRVVYAYPPGYGYSPGYYAYPPGY